MITTGPLSTPVASPADLASRSRNGIHDLLDVETTRAVADTVANLLRS